ncbi:MAG: hypothetical protein ACMUIP_16315 [bacterium]
MYADKLVLDLGLCQKYYGLWEFDGMRWTWITPLDTDNTGIDLSRPYRLKTHADSCYYYIYLQFVLVKYW